MTQTTILASGTTAATSSDVTVAVLANAVVGLFATGDVPDGVQVGVYADTPGDDVLIDTLGAQRLSVVLAGPGTFRLKRAISANTA